MSADARWLAQEIGRWYYNAVKLLLWAVFRLGFGLEVSGQEQVPAHSGVILASNHASFLDPPVVGAACPRRVHFLARADLYRHRWLGAFLRSIGAVPLRRGEADREAIQQALAWLRQGEVIAVFPEGSRQISGRLGSARRGVGFLAQTARVPVVPVLLAGTYDALPPRARRLRRAKIRVAFGRPIPYTHLLNEQTLSAGGFPAATAREAQRQLAEAVTRQWQQLAEQIGRAPRPG
jgi:1-acyl-sn-glycerol-3-phosphate acyltransferase